MKSSLTFRWKTTLEQSVGPLLLVKSSLGDFFCFIHSFGTVPASWRWGDGELERESYLGSAFIKMTNVVVYCFICTGPSVFIEQMN